MDSFSGLPTLCGVVLLSLPLLLFLGNIGGAYPSVTPFTWTSTSFEGGFVA